MRRCGAAPRRPVDASSAIGKLQSHGTEACRAHTKLSSGSGEQRASEAGPAAGGKWHVDPKEGASASATEVVCGVWSVVVGVSWQWRKLL